MVGGEGGEVIWRQILVGMLSKDKSEKCCDSPSHSLERKLLMRRLPHCCAVGTDFELPSKEPEGVS